MLFRQPSLATVTNIFVLPYAKTTWIALFVLLGVASSLLWFQLYLDRQMGYDADGREFGDVVTFISGAASQQGQYNNLIYFLERTGAVESTLHCN